MQAGGDSTLTRIDKLDEDSRLKEVARMLGGDDCSAESLAHARQMMAVPAARSKAKKASPLEVTKNASKNTPKNVSKKAPKKAPKKAQK